MSEYRVVDSKHVISWGWDYAKILDTLIAFDYETLRGLAPENEGTTKQWVGVFSKSSDTYKFVIDKKDNIVGYWHFIAPTKDSYEALKHGKMRESQITRIKINKMKPHKTYNIYLTVMSVRLDLRHSDASRLLVRSFFESLTEYAKKDIFINELCTDAFTEDGRKFFKSLKMKYTAKAKDGGSIYARKLYPFSKNDPLKRNTKLVDLYNKKFS